MPKKIRNSVEPVPLAEAPQYFFPRDWKDYIAKVKIPNLRRPDADPARVSERQKVIRLTAIEFALVDSNEAFWTDIPKGNLIFVGYPDRGDGGLRRIPNHVLYDPDRSLDFPKGKISGSGLCFVNVGVLKASEAKNVPEFSREGKGLLDGSQFPQITKGKPGPKQKWDWDAAARELVKLAEESDELPWPKAKIVNHLADWFSATYGDSPADSLLREKLGKWLPIDYHDRK